MSVEAKLLSEDVMRRALFAGTAQIADRFARQSQLNQGLTDEQWANARLMAHDALAAALPVFLEWHEAEKFEWRASASRIMDHVVRDTANGIADAIEAVELFELSGNHRYGANIKADAERVARTWPDREGGKASPDAPASTERAQEPVSGAPASSVAPTGNVERSSDVLVDNLDRKLGGYMTGAEMTMPELP